MSEKVNLIKLSKNFSLYEFESPDTREVKIYPSVIDFLQYVRNKVKRPIIITSGYRTIEYNKKVGGKEKSQHLIGSAVDISLIGHKITDMNFYLFEAGFKQVIYYSKEKMIHCALFHRNPIL